MLLAARPDDKERSDNHSDSGDDPPPVDERFADWNLFHWRLRNQGSEFVVERHFLRVRAFLIFGREQLCFPCLP